ncbi:MAG: ADP-forming succinate--CoA ligase subunit beta [Dehalococcoidales bacterium]|nr:ADP-forming succinate--CoA ligase subunit beta [Dehalococcoidales bacterium]
MNLHEYQARDLLKKYNINFPTGEIGSTPQEIFDISKKFGGEVVAKAQIHSGGRGKAGGVKLCSTPSEAKNFANSILGKKIVTSQTDSEGVIVEKILITNTTIISREIYLSIVIDPDFESPVLIASSEGGTEIEKMAEESPNKITKIAFDPVLGAKPYELRRVISKLEIPKNAIKDFYSLVNNLFKAFIETDSTLIEINPLIIDDNENIVPLDCKINLDDDSYFRQKELFSLRDKNQENPIETRAKDFDLAYVKLDKGNVGCLVNGAGLAMATMDVTTKSGCFPANFLDVGGSTDKEKIKEAFRILVSDENVEYLLINLFAGIARADLIAQGVVEAAEETLFKLPIIVSMRGTNSEEGFEILKRSKLNIHIAKDLGQAANILSEINKANK